MAGCPWAPLQNPFGEAKPREAVIASRVGKTEEEILKEEVKKEKLHVGDGRVGAALAPGVGAGQVECWHWRCPPL